jgi:hypothetical protein
LGAAFEQAPGGTRMTPIQQIFADQDRFSRIKYDRMRGIDGRKNGRMILRQNYSLEWEVLPKFGNHTTAAPRMRFRKSFCRKIILPTFSDPRESA